LQKKQVILVKKYVKKHGNRRVANKFKRLAFRQIKIAKKDIKFVRVVRRRKHRGSICAKLKRKNIFLKRRNKSLKKSYKKLIKNYRLLARRFLRVVQKKK